MEALIDNTGGIQVAAGLFVLPAKVTALPDIGPAVAAARFAGTALEAVVVRVTRFVDAEQVAKIAEMPLRPGAFGGGIVFQ